MKNTIIIPGLVLCYLSAGCGNPSGSRTGAISSDSSVIAAGKHSFSKNCASCHEFVNDGIGPALGGITDDVPLNWIEKFIKSPQQVISSGDRRADSLVKKFGSVMPSFSAMDDQDLNGIIAFMHSQQSMRGPVKKNPVNGIADPFPEKIKMSGLTINISPWLQLPASDNDGKYPKTRITKMEAEPGTNDIFVNDLRGKLYKITNDKPKIYLDFTKLRPGFIAEPGLATGFGSFTFHPDFLKNGLLYTTHTESPKSGIPDFAFNDSIQVEVQWVLTEWKVDNRSADSLSGSSRELLRINMVAGAHGVQEILFNPLATKKDKDYGLLYVGIGDGASVQLGFPFVTHGRNKIWGSIIRINPLGHNSKNGRYGIPDDNPFSQEKDPDIVKEIYAYGFRNPHRLTWTKEGQLLASNIGQANIEAIDLIKPGQDYGWPLREGSFRFEPYSDLNSIFPLPANDSIYHFTYPVAQFDHDEGNAISGGYEYWGKAVPALTGKFLFGDIPSGRLFFINSNEIGGSTAAVIKEWKITIDGVSKTLKEVCGSDRVDLHFGRDAQGELYILTKSDGKIYKIKN